MMYTDQIENHVQTLSTETIENLIPNLLEVSKTAIQCRLELERRRVEDVNSSSGLLGQGPSPSPRTEYATASNSAGNIQPPSMYPQLDAGRSAEFRSSAIAPLLIDPTGLGSPTPNPSPGGSSGYGHASDLVKPNTLGILAPPADGSVRDRFKELKWKELSNIPDSVKKGIHLILDDRFLTDDGYQEVIHYVQARWYKQRAYERRTDFDKGILAPGNHIISPTLQLYECRDCTGFFDDKEKLKNHEISVHKSVVCCGQLIPEAEFPQHKKKHMIEPPKWKCHKCQTSIGIYKAYKEHVQTHLAEPYKEPSQEFLTRKVPTVPIPLKERVTQMDVKKPMMNQMRNQRPSIGMKIPNLNQVEMKRAVELYTGDKSDTDEVTVLHVVMKSGQKAPSRAGIRPPKQAKKTPRKGGESSSRKSGKSKFSESDSDPDYTPEVDLATVKRRRR